MNYKGYVAEVSFDDEAGIFHGEVVNTRDVITFQGRSVDELREALAGSIEDYLEWCAERGKEPERPFSGRLVLRMPPDLHRAAALAARREGKSLNRWIADALARSLREPTAA